jgi:hypothetical protein
VAKNKKPLAALNTPLDENDEVMKLSKRTFLPPRLNLFQCHVIPRLAVLEVFIVGDKEEGLHGEVDNMTLASESVGFWVILNVKSTQQTYEC